MLHKDGGKPHHATGTRHVFSDDEADRWTSTI
jgi:hypothetical protein